MNSFPPDLEQFVRHEVASGRYPSADEVVWDGLRLLQERERHSEELRAAVRLGLDQLSNGEYTDYDDDALRDRFEEIKREGRERLRKEQPGA